MKHICRTCKQEVNRIHDGYTKCGKNIKIYTDMNGSRWNGNRCHSVFLRIWQRDTRLNNMQKG